MRVIEDQDLYWLIGLLEGEGTFLAARSRRGMPVVRVEMTDKDVVTRVGALLKRAVIPLRARKAHYKPPYVTCIKGAPAIALMRTILPQMGAVRQAQRATCNRFLAGTSRKMAATSRDLLGWELRTAREPS